MFGAGTEPIGILDVKANDLGSNVRQMLLTNAIARTRLVRQDGTMSTLPAGAELPSGLKYAQGLLYFENDTPFVKTPVGSMPYDPLWSGRDLCGGGFRAYDGLRLAEFFVKKEN